MKKRYFKYAAGLVIIILLSTLGTILSSSDVLRGLRDSLTNSSYRAGVVNKDIVIVGIDDKSLNTASQNIDFTSRSTLAQVFANLGALQPKVVALNYFFTQETRGIDDKNLTSLGKKLIKENLTQDELVKELGKYKVSPHPSDIKLSESLKTLPNPLFAVKVNSLERKDNHFSAKEIMGSIKNFSQFGEEVVIFNSASERDSIVRTLPLQVENRGKTYDSLPLAIAKYVTEKSYNDVPTAKNGQMYIRFYGSPDSYKVISAIDLYNNTVKKEEIENKIILFGAIGNALNDQTSTPISPKLKMSTTEVQANALQTLLSEQYLTDATPIIHFGILIILATILTAIGLFSSVTLGTATLFVLCIIYYEILIKVAFERGVILEPLFVYLTLIINLISVTLYTYFSEARQKDFLSKAFKAYVSKDVLKQILKNPEKLKLGGEEREVSALFCDIKDFTTISEKLSPQELVSILNIFFGNMSDIVTQNGGTVDKFEGDAVMAVFGAPMEDADHAIKACMCALKMQAKLKSMKDEASVNSNYEVFKRFFIRIGINTGKAIAGNIGSKDRFDYTVMGDSINLASRLEGANKTYGSGILIGEKTYEHIKDAFVTRVLDKLRVKGKTEPIYVYEVVALKAELIPQLPSMEGFDAIESLKSMEIALKHNEAMEYYFAGKFSEAKKIFDELLEKSSGDTPVEVLTSRCTTFLLNNPGPNWDGVYTMTTK